MRVTISDIAMKAGVSKTTVSRIINGNYSQVTEQTKDRVLTIIQSLDYTPNALAKGLKSMRTNVIGMVLSDLKNPFWFSVLEGAEDTCRAHGYNLMICNANNEWKWEEEHIKGLRNKQVDGIIVNPTMKNHLLFESLINDHYPIVALNRKMKGVPIETVAVNNVAGAKLATTHLIRLGKRKIAIIVYSPEAISPRLERIEGYVQALNLHGINVSDSLIHMIDDKKGNAKERAKQILSGADRPEAIFSTNNMMSLEILEAIKELNLNVPLDLALIGYDETVWSKHLDPPLTTVKQPAYEMGEIAAERLIHLINCKGKERAKVKIHLLEPTLVIRDSCGYSRQDGYAVL